MMRCMPFDLLRLRLARSVPATARRSSRGRTRKRRSHAREGRERVFLRLLNCSGPAHGESPTGVSARVPTRASSRSGPAPLLSLLAGDRARDAVLPWPATSAAVREAGGSDRRGASVLPLVLEGVGIAWRIGRPRASVSLPTAAARLSASPCAVPRGGDPQLKRDTCFARELGVDRRRSRCRRCRCCGRQRCLRAREGAVRRSRWRVMAPLLVVIRLAGSARASSASRVELARRGGGGRLRRALRGRRAAAACAAHEFRQALAPRSRSW